MKAQLRNEKLLTVLGKTQEGKETDFELKGDGRLYYKGRICVPEDEELKKNTVNMVIVANPCQFNIPDWFLNRQKDYKDGKHSKVVYNSLDMKLIEDLEQLKKIKNHHGLHRYWDLQGRGQHTKFTGCKGKTVGISKRQ
ncbi:hypothetical protein P3X46_004787 [Hevea brasiliensis]|uniref:40S ribosomal protein S18 n=1 Tax=Hevea brasiliensis TaxID=3981 RepID=A0ABQ9N2Q3_HEVBR|nr:hypothetical protein P3X46_004787 [Hevea brasiliensis]